MSPRVYRTKHIPDVTGLSLRTVQRLEAQGLFPVHAQLTERTIGWPADEVDAWVKARMDERKAA